MEEHKEAIVSQIADKGLLKPSRESNTNFKATHATMQSTFATVNRATLETQIYEKKKAMDEQVSTSLDHDSTPPYTDEDSSLLPASDQEGDLSFSN